MTETRGVLYLNQGIKCIVRMLVSIYTLRKHYDGPITVMLVGPQPLWFLEALSDLKAGIQVLDDDGSHPLVRKAALWRNSPYDLSMFIDADTVVVDRIDEYFDKIREYGFCTGEFAGWTTQGRTISKRIRSFSEIVPDYIKPAINYGKATNTGIFGFTKDAEILEEWESLTRKGKAVNRIPDEIACQILLPRYRHWLAPVQWGVSVRMSPRSHYEGMKIVHYHGRKHAGPWELCSIWKQNFWEFCFKNPQLKEHLMQDYGDRRLRRYLRQVKEKDLTIVSAVSKKYMDSFCRNYPLWMKTEGIMEYPMLLFVHADAIKDPRLSILRPNVRIVQWDMEKYDSMRELMLSAFVLGTAQYVGTKWWMKVDADATPKQRDNMFGYSLEFPSASWKNNALSGHKWGYTLPGEFIVRLEKWAAEHPKLKDTKPLFEEAQYPEILAKKRFGHPRIASFLCLQSSEFTRLCADLAGGKRLPVPSHDTYLWYVAARLGYPVVRTNLKAGFSA